ncbi:MAG: spore germination protein [Bacillota bacterium]|nr:spore germination protein [Bacillota bacterium]MDK2925950.1 spore germination protein [Bacillota bacterium]MDK2960803.1 spore germination protein [Bacillota bacterium]
MREEGRISTWQLATLLGSFLIGSSTILFPTAKARQDSWLAVLVALVAGVGASWLWLTLTRIQEAPAVSGILLTLGPYLGIPLAILYLWYYLHLGALVVRNISEIYVTAVMPETPIVVFTGILVFLAALAVRGGVEVLGRLAELLFPLLVLAILTGHILIVSTPRLVRWEYLLPVLENGFAPVLQAALSMFAFPFGETVLFVNLVPFTLNKACAGRPVIISTIGVGLLLTVVAALHTATLGADVPRVNFPGLALLHEVNVGDFVTRMEVLGIFVWTFGTFLKIGVCYWALALGLAELLGLEDYRVLVLPLGVIMASLSILVYDTFAAMTTVATSLYPFYAFPFQVLFPLLLLLVAFLRRQKKKAVRPDPKMARKEQ